MQNPNIHLRNDYMFKEKPAAKQVAIRLIYVSCKEARNDRELKRNPCTQAIKFFLEMTLTIIEKGMHVYTQ